MSGNSFSLNKFLLTLNGKPYNEFDKSTDAFSLAPAGDAGAFVSGVWVDSCEYVETLTLKLPQHASQNAYLQEIYDEQRRDLSKDNEIQMRAYDAINGDEITAVGGRIKNQGGFVRGTGYNPNTWTIDFPKVTRKLGS